MFTSKLFTRKLRITFLFMLIALFMISCGLLAPQPQAPENNAEALYTQAAQTVQAQLTQQALNTQPVQPTQAVTTPVAPFTATPTMQPVIDIPSATPTSQASATATLPLPTQLPPTATSVPILCDHASFVKDVTVADGTAYAPGAEFSKTWRLRNNGSCTWNSSYALVFNSGDRMSGSRVIPLPGNVRPGETVDVSVSLLAPTQQGRYRGYWMLSNTDGDVFGIGEDADKAFWVEIRVVSPNESFAYDFAINMCTATWRSSAGSLTCPGNPDSDNGSVVYLDKPTLENGRHEDESTIWTRPEATRDGWIQGVYPPYKVKAGDHFLSEVGCLEGNKSCEVVFSLDYQVSGGAVKNLGEWYEVYDGSTTRIDVDLSSLEGKTVQFILSVTNYGKPSHANPFWLVPSVRQFKPTPTPPVVYAPPIEAARQRVAQDLGISANEITVVSFELTEWQDSCLGMDLPDQVCSQVIIPGYRINMNTKNKAYEAHTNMDASIVYWFEL